MGLFYLAALILGFGTLLLQLVFAHLGGGEAGAEAHDAEALTGPELDVAGGHELSAEHAPDSVPAPLGATAGLFLSIRFWLYALMAFGMVGSALHYLRLAGATATLLLAITSGFVSGLSAHLTFRLLRAGVSSSTSQEEAIGRVGQITVPMRKGGLGKVRLELKGKRVDLLAVTDCPEVAAGAEVVVVEYRGDHVLVEPLSPNNEPK